MFKNTRWQFVKTFAPAHYSIVQFLRVRAKRSSQRALRSNKEMSRMRYENVPNCNTFNFLQI